MSRDTPTEFYAYGKMNVGIEAVMRLHSVKRWHMIDSTRNQTLAEHSANVAVLAGYIATTSPQMYFGPSYHVYTAGVLHDMGEVFIGDIPTPTKSHVRSKIEDLEKETLPVFFWQNHIDDKIELLIKICDLADGIRFIRLHGVDVTALHARQGLEKQLKEKWQKAYAEWPLPVHDHVKDLVDFYAYR